MRLITTFYFSNVAGCKVFDADHKLIGRLTDIAINASPPKPDENEPFRPEVVALQIKTSESKKLFSFSKAIIRKEKGSYQAEVNEFSEFHESEMEDRLLLGVNFLDKQIVDINGRKLVRVNDIRLVSLPGGIFAIAVDVGIEGLLRRIGIAETIKSILSLIGIRVPSRFILFDDVAAVDGANLNIRLSKTSSKLHTLHPSDIADIIEDLGKESKTSVFSSLDEEKAADVLEELEPMEQVLIIESMSIEKAADVLEKMPANEAADLIDELESDRAELLLKEMEIGSSEEVRELLEYPDTTVGSLMTTELLSFSENVSVDDVLNEIRKVKPEMEMLYNLFITDKNEKLIATLSLRDLLISQPCTPVAKIMKRDPICVYDDDKVGSLAEIISKYNLLAIPVVDQNDKLEGMVVIDDVVEDLLGKRRTT
ncbi:MAG: CBS domain-containing protein [Bacteroidia bacterium]|nr:CBS domain-containing protein [Bacteroidia bacterium]